jgi:cyclic beta-1,2-glucan synthetase
MATPNHYAADMLLLRGLSTSPKPDVPNAGSRTHASARAAGALYERMLSGAWLEVRSWKVRAIDESLPVLGSKWRRAKQAILGASGKLQESKGGNFVAVEWSSDEQGLLESVLKETRDSLTKARMLPQVEIAGAQRVPRAYAAGEAFLRAVKNQIAIEPLVTFLKRAQEHFPFRMAELWSLKAFMELALLEQMAEKLEYSESGLHVRTDGTIRSTQDAEPETSELIRSIRQLGGLDWQTVFEEVSVTETILRRDPIGAYQQMDPETRDVYRESVAQLSAHSPFREQDIARAALDLAREAQAAGAGRAQERSAHVGYYLMGEGKSALKQAVGYQTPFSEHARDIVLRWPSFFYLSGIAFLTIAVMALFELIPGVRGLRWYEAALFLLPALECAVALVNLFSTMLVPPRRLPKLDFSEGIPEASTTMVVIPMLLGSEEQVRQAARDLEIRYLGNRDANLHFALLTDPPDSMQRFDEKDALAGLCSSLIENLNKKYASEGKGTFYLFHRERTFNPVEKTWMGWERKRGKLLNLNDLLLGRGNEFAIALGNLSILPRVRYVLTLDLDTQLPRDAARKMVGAIAHPLNRAVLDPKTNTVVEGYGILQPRVEISVKSKNRSRLAGIFSGDAGLDTYTRAISDVYQDLFGEGIFTGKGIYEVETFHQVLDHRFPCNTVLSHDLLEGVYARAGLISDVEVIDDYPSHVSAYSRRKHRWVRGDWQIIRWLLPRVPERSGELVANPLSGISRWKIVDNLRRSLSDFGFFLLLTCGWILLPGKALYYTLAALLAISLPVYVQFAITLIRAARMPNFRAACRNIFSEFTNVQAALVFRIALLFHQSLVTIDAIVRAVVRMTVTRKKLLQWETAADAESAISKRTPVEIYLDLTPWLCFVIDILVIAIRPSSFFVALPFLALWSCSKALCDWLNLPGSVRRHQLNEKGRTMLRGVSLQTWRFFREFSNASENWLIPDVIHEDGDVVAHRISPTNLGLLLNSRLAAMDLGWSTLPEFTADIENTCGTMARMPKFQGSFYNWYDTLTLEPLPPFFLSTVDNGNLVCCLWTLKQSCIEASSAPLFRNVQFQGLADHLAVIREMLPRGVKNDDAIWLIEKLHNRIHATLGSANWPSELPRIAADIAEVETLLSRTETGSDVNWWMRELSERIVALQTLVREFAPWLSPEFAPHCRSIVSQKRFAAVRLTLESLPLINNSVGRKVREMLLDDSIDEETRSAMELLLASLSKSTSTAKATATRLQGLASKLDTLANDIDFAPLYDPTKKQLSIGYDSIAESLHSSHYDLLASEARSAVFVAIAKGEIPQASWFHLGRARRSYKNKGVLLSWTGTMFEYLLPSLWMNSSPNTLLHECSETAVRAQQNFAEAKSIPWGISEASCSERYADNHFRYHAFGLQSLALSRFEGDDLVISPYSSFLALLVDAPASARNIAEMKRRGWTGSYGFYDACDFTASRMHNGKSSEPVRCWMAHHQGMSLVAAASVLCDMAMQKRFHSEPRVAATERLLQEKIPRDPVLELELMADEPVVQGVSATNPGRQELLPVN